MRFDIEPRETAARMFCAKMLFGLVIVSAFGAAAFGPDWEEGNNDAGNTLNTAMAVYAPPGNSSINSITGCLGCKAGPGDFEDIYLITVNDPEIFQISTVPADGGFANFDSKILVFDAGGHALLGNDDEQAGQPYSRVLSQPTELCKMDVEITEPGLYFIAITSSSRNSTVDLNGNQVPGFPSNNGTQIFCATSAGISNVLDGWEGEGEHGSYTLACTGVSGVAMCLTDCPADFNLDGRVDGVDLGYLMANWNVATCVDLAGGPVLNSEDLGILLASWGGC